MGAALPGGRSRADAVVPSQLRPCAAIGYAAEAKIPRGAASRPPLRGPVVHLPEPTQRDLAVRMKLKSSRRNVRDRRIIVVEDRCRGTTTRGKIGALRPAGPRDPPPRGQPADPAPLLLRHRFSHPSNSSPTRGRRSDPR